MSSLPSEGYLSGSFTTPDRGCRVTDLSSLNRATPRHPVSTQNQLLQSHHHTPHASPPPTPFRLKSAFSSPRQYPKLTDQITQPYSPRQSSAFVAKTWLHRLEGGGGWGREYPVLGTIAVAIAWRDGDRRDRYRDLISRLECDPMGGKAEEDERLPPTARGHRIPMIRTKSRSRWRGFTDTVQYAVS